MDEPLVKDTTIQLNYGQAVQLRTLVREHCDQLRRLIAIAVQNESMESAKSHAAELTTFELLLSDIRDGMYQRNQKI